MSLQSFRVYGLTSLILHGTSGPSGGSIFLLVKKDGGERHAKGLRSRPLDSGFLYGGMMPDVLCAYVFATVRLTRLSRLRRSAYSLASACCTALETLKTYATDCSRMNLAVGCFLKCFYLSWQRSRHEGAGISEAPPLIKIRAGHQCGHATRQFGKWCQH